MMRGGLISMLYGKATEIALVDVDAASSITLMSADIERIVTGMETGHEVRITKARATLFIPCGTFHGRQILVADTWRHEATQQRGTYHGMLLSLPHYLC